MSNKKSSDSRAIAAMCLASVTTGRSLSQQIPIFEQQLIERERPLFRQLCYGVLRSYPKLNAITAQLLSKPTKAKDSDILMLLLLGIYQLSDTRVPDYAAINATVASTRSLKKHWAKGLVNGVLRQWQRNHETLLAQLSTAEQASHPQWLYQNILEAWPDQAVELLQANNQNPPMCLRVNQKHYSTLGYLALLEDQNIAAGPCVYAPHGIRLEKPVVVDQLPGFGEGGVSVQDEAPQLSAELLSLSSGQRVLDACCAPGGKTCHILESCEDLATLTALDIDESRLVRVNENLTRLKLEASVICGDASKPDDWWDGQYFDRILLDAPCSATGVIRRNPDIKLHRKAQDIKKLAKLQLSILSALWKTLSPGGQLLYATCSVLPQENEHVVEAFLNEQDDASVIEIDANWGIKGKYGRQLLPQPEGHDGFYYALLHKNS